MIGILISAWLDVRGKPLRTFAAIAGMVAAIGAVILVDAAGILSRSANNDFIVRRYGRSATVGIGLADVPPMSGSDANALAARLTSVLRHNGVTRITTETNLAINLVHGDATSSEVATWVSSDYPDVSFVQLIAGRFPSATAQGNVAHAVISIDVARRLGYVGPDAVGAQLWFAFSDHAGDMRTAQMWPIVVDGVAASIGSDTDPAAILIVSDTPRPELNNRLPSNWLVTVNPADVALVKGLVADVTVPGTTQSAFTARRLDLSQDLAPLLAQQEVTAQAVTWVALIVGGLGILGVGLASVRERGKDFGLQRALGASKRRIFTGVIVQSLLEVLLAAAIAIPLAAISVELFARHLVLASLPLPSSTELPVRSAARGLVAALTVGLLAGLLPAARAVRASIVQALRD